MNIKPYIQELINILRREIRSFNVIIELLILEEKGLVESDNELIMNVLEKQEDVFSSIACLERSRIDVISKIAEQIGEDPDLLTITDISEMIDNPIKKELIETAHVLLQINEDIKHKKVTNNMLIKQGMIIVEGNIRYILKLFGREDMLKEIYSSSADISRISSNIYIDGRM